MPYPIPVADDLWEVLRRRLIATARIRALIGAHGVVETSGSPAGPPEPSSRNGPFARIVLKPAETDPTVISAPGEAMPVYVLVVIEAADFRALGYDVGEHLAHIARAVQRSLEGYVPSGLKGARATYPLTLYRRPQPAPMLDESRGLWYLSLELRTELFPR